MSVTRNQGMQSASTATNNRVHQAKQQQTSRQVGTNFNKSTLPPFLILHIH